MLEKSKNDEHDKKPDRDDVYEGQPVIYSQTCENLIPLDAEKLFNTRSFEFYIFKDKKTGKKNLGIKVISYHPGELRISLPKLEEILTKLNNMD